MGVRPPAAALLVCLLLTACGDEQPLAAAGAPSPSSVQTPPQTAPAPGELPKRPGQQVVPDHCGVQPVIYDGRKWEVQRPPFDMGNAPDTFSGFGAFRRTGDSLLFEDREGTKLTFTPDDGVEPACM